jgi:hypothetical protein
MMHFVSLDELSLSLGHVLFDRTVSSGEEMRVEILLEIINLLKRWTQSDALVLFKS